MSSNVYRLDYDKAEILMRAETRVEKDLRLRACRKEPWTVAWIESMEREAWLYDVGASTGPYSLLAAKLGVRVVAIEPQPASAARLFENVTGNGLNDMVCCLPVALSSADGPHTLRYLGTGPGKTVDSEVFRQEARQYGLPEEAMSSVPHHTLAFCLDTLVRELSLPVPNYLKLDVDEGEVAVLEGARWCLQHPDFRSLMVEMAPHAREAIFGLMKECGLVLKREYRERDFPPHLPVPYGLFCKPELKYG